MGELGLVHRNEKSGTLHGLMRVRSFTQDDAHIFMREDQIMDEIQGVMRLIAIKVPMTRCLPETSFQHNRRRDLNISFSAMDLPRADQLL